MDLAGLGWTLVEFWVSRLHGKSSDVPSGNPSAAAGSVVYGGQSVSAFTFFIFDSALFILYTGGVASRNNT